ncbi:MAG: sulfurtransferase [Desulfobacteraceae bacterium]|nr:sulfurtransferase [Desulfobacteraceae bacterium]
MIPVFADQSVPIQKRTALELYLTSKDAYAKWKADPDNINIIDVRTHGEYIFVGHAPMASHIPFMFLKNKLDPVTLRPVMPFNEKFVEDVKKKFKKTDTLFVMCRSGGRSAASINKLAKAGYKNVYNIIDGFEGDSKNGKRTVNGWKNSGAPWTYKLDRNLAYQP